MSQVGHLYFGAVGQFYIGANTFGRRYQLALRIGPHPVRQARLGHAQRRGHRRRGAPGLDLPHGLLLELLCVLRSRLLLVQFILPSRHSPGWGYALQNSRATSLSRPAWARGLKPAGCPQTRRKTRSRPAWARGPQRTTHTTSALAIRVAPRVFARLPSHRFSPPTTPLSLSLPSDTRSACIPRHSTPCACPAAPSTTPPPSP